MSLQIGQMNSLKILKHVDFGVYLDGGDLTEILLPEKDVPDNAAPGDVLEVFIYSDSEDRLIATTRIPFAYVGDFALLEVVAVDRVGAFLDWGLTKDLFLPFAEQVGPVEVGDEVVVAVYLDNTDRIAASMRLSRHVDKKTDDYTEGQPVALMIVDQTDLGFKAIIENRHMGVLYSDEVFQKLYYGQRINGFIKKIREDGKIDLALSQTGHKAAAPTADEILRLLKENGGFMELTDKTSPEKIYELFKVSKKKYKIALGGLYKKRLVEITDQGIKLVKKN